MYNSEKSSIFTQIERLQAAINRLDSTKKVDEMLIKNYNRSVKLLYESDIRI